MHYRPEIDGLRALAVLPAIFFHAGLESFRGGFVGVDVFFVISGYLITSIILSELDQGRFSIIDFYERRARRIMPALILVMLSCLPFAWFWLLPADMKDFSKSLVAVALFGSNFFFGRELGYFDTKAESSPLLHTWSLAVEEQYYVLFPLLLIILWKSGRQKILAILLFSALASLVLAHWLVHSRPMVAFYLLPTRCWELLIGAFVAIYMSDSHRRAFRKSVNEIGAGVGLLLVGYATFSFSKETPFPGLYALVPTLGTAMIILFSSEQTAVGKLIGSRALVGIGLISYSAYLWHQPMFAFARHRGLSESNTSAFLGLSALALITAYFSWRYVETPFRQRQFITRKPVFALALSFSILFMTLGAVGYLKNGNVWRYTEDVERFIEFKNKSDAYTWELKDRIRNRPFESGKTKVLLIGDSNSGDFANIISNIEQKDLISLSSLTIYVGCGNLYIPRAEFSHRVAAKTVRACRFIDDLFSEKSTRLMEQADVVIFAAGWSEWEANMILESHTRLTNRFGSKFWYFGNKHLDFSPPDFIRTNGHTRFPTQAPPVAANQMINKILRQALGERLIDPYDIFCDNNNCLMANEAGVPLIYDGFHLSREGSRFFAAKLENTIQLALKSGQ